FSYFSPTEFPRPLLGPPSNPAPKRNRLLPPTKTLKYVLRIPRLSPYLSIAKSCLISSFRHTYPRRRFRDFFTRSLQGLRLRTLQGMTSRDTAIKDASKT